MVYLIDIALFAVVFAGMEGFAWVMHRHVMHGALWCWHRSHHEPRTGVFERNDLFAMVFAAPAIVLIYLGVHGVPVLLPVGVGITAYGLVYLLFHDGLVHKRFTVPWSAANPYWRARVQAHLMHHAIRTRKGGVSFGFLWAAPPRVLKTRLAMAGVGRPKLGKAHPPS